MSVRRSLFWSYGAQAVVTAINFTSSVIVARILAPYEMGVFALAMTMLGILAIMAAFGIGPYLIRDEHLDPEIRATAFTINALLNAAISAVLLLGVVCAPLLDLHEGVRGVLLILAFLPLLQIFEFLPLTLLQREMNFKLISLINITKALTTAIAIVGFAIAGYSSLSPALGIVAGQLLSTVAYNVLGRHHASVRLGVRGSKEMLRFGVQMMSIGGVNNIVQRLSEAVLARFLGLAALGIFTRASGLSNQIWDNIYGLSTRIIFVRMAEEVRESGTLDKTFLMGISIITAIVWPLLMLIATLSGPLIHTLYGERWLEAAPPLSLMMIGHMIGLGFGMNWELCVLRKRTGWAAKVEISRAIVGLASFTAGAAFGLVQAAAMRLVEAFLGLALYAPSLRSLAGTQRGEIARVYRHAALLTLLAAGPTAAVMLWLGWSPRASWWFTAPAVAAGVASWLIALRALRHPLWNEIARIAVMLQRRAGAVS